MIGQFRLYLSSWMSFAGRSTFCYFLPPGGSMSTPHDVWVSKCSQPGLWETQNRHDVKNSVMPTLQTHQRSKERNQSWDRTGCEKSQSKIFLNFNFRGGGGVFWNMWFTMQVKLRGYSGCLLCYLYTRPDDLHLPNHHAYMPHPWTSASLRRMCQSWNPH